MNRTKRLMTAVTASLLLAGTLPASGALPCLQGQTTPAPDESWKTDPNVGRASNTIFEWLQGNSGTEDQAKTQDEILKKFPALDQGLVENALKRSQWEGSGIRRTGEGSKSSPYRYWVCQSNCG
jgi:hypothetical protein